MPRVTPLQYEQIDGKIYVAAARGIKADWFRNIQANSEVELRIKSKHFKGQAETVTDPAKIADFLEYRLVKHPRMLATIMRIEGLPYNPTRQQLETYATNRAMVIIHPTEELSKD
jgi:deazaflavin-dependent oxidoreductase (nitroreductase family)